jgi:hypothetical protein
LSGLVLDRGALGIDVESGPSAFCSISKVPSERSKQRESGDISLNAGIASSRLIPHGYGKSDFVATNDTTEGRAQNRRVELVPVQ